MSTSVIVTKRLDPTVVPPSDRIELSDWLRLIESDPALRLRNDPTVVTTPSGAVVSVPPMSGQTDLLLNGAQVPFLGFRQGELVMRLAASMDRPSDPVRQKVADVAVRLGAQITHDVGDEVLDW